LAGQAVDQVDVDGFKADVPCRCHELEYLRVGLYAMNCNLHVVVKVLYAETDAVEAELVQSLEPGGVYGAWIYLYRSFGTRRKGKTRLQHVDQCLQLGVVHKCRRATAQM